jgi:DHA1 family multidrug resistance protein-like MFS transporter
MPKSDKLIFTTLFFSIFATITGVGIVVPLLPVYARSLGAGGLRIGLIFGAFSLSRVLFLPYFGRLSDRVGRKPLIVPGLIAYTLVSAAFLVSENVNTFITIRLIQGVASAMLLPVIQAYVGDITPQGREGVVMGLFNTSIFCGLSLGPVLGGIINDRFNLDAAFLSMGALSFFGFLLSLFLLPPIRDERVVHRKRPPVQWRRLIRSRDIAGVFVFRFSYTLCIGVIWGFLPVLAAAQLSLSSAAIGFLVMLGIMVSGIIQVPMGWVADRTNKTVLVITGGIGVSYAVLSYLWAESFADMVLASILFGVAGGICMPALMAAVVIIGDRAEAMGSVMALLTVAHSLGMFVGAMLAGLMMDLMSLRAAFPVGAVLMALGTTAFAFCHWRPRSAIQPPTAGALGHSGCGFYDDPIGLEQTAEKHNDH